LSLTGQHPAHARIFIRTGVIAGAIASCLMMYPLGDSQARNVATYQPVTLSAMEGLFHTEKGAPLAILGQPNMETEKLDNPLIIPDALSFNLGEMKSDSARINELLVNQRFRYLKDLGCNRFFVDEK
jgi:cytochrome bd-type quinol oxidase subunit 1